MSKLPIEPFICGHAGEQDTGGLYDRFFVCPIFGSDYVQSYVKAPTWRYSNEHPTDDNWVVAVVEFDNKKDIMLLRFINNNWVSVENEFINNTKIVRWSSDAVLLFGSLLD